MTRIETAEKAKGKSKKGIDWMDDMPRRTLKRHASFKNKIKAKSR